MIHRIHIRIDDRGDSSWPVTLTHYAGSAPAVVLRASALIDTQQLLAELSPHSYGIILGQAVLGAPMILAAFARARGVAGPRLIVLIDLHAADLLDLHWERLCLPVDDERWVMASLDQRFCYARYLSASVDRPYDPAPLAAAATLLLVASPEGLARFQLAPFDADATARGLRAVIGPHRCDLLAMTGEAVGPPTLDALCTQLTERYYPMLHIVCHGRRSSVGEPLLYLANAEGQAEPVPITTLRDRLDQIGDSTHRPLLIFLMSCSSAAPESEAAFGAAATRLVAELGTPAVIAMTDRISIATSEALASQFYRRLYRHGEPNRALTEARAGLAGRADVSVAALYTRLEGQPIIVPSYPLWLRTLVATAAVLGTLIATLVLIYLFAFDPVVSWAAAAFASVLYPPMEAADAVRVAYSVDPSCASSDGVAEAIRGAFSARADTRRTSVQLDPRLSSDAALGDADVLISWGCATKPDLPISLHVTFLGQARAPIALFREPDQIILTATAPQARTISRAAALYAAGAYAVALEEIGSYGQNPAHDAVGLAWLRASLLLRAERWDEAGSLFGGAAAHADSGLRATLLGNQATVSLYAREARKQIVNDPQDCAAGGRDAIAQALDAPSFDQEQRARLMLLSGWRLTLCPRNDEELLQEAPVTLAAATELIPPGNVLHPIWTLLMADNTRKQDLPDNDLQGQVEDLALRAIAELPTLPQPYRTLGLLYGDAGRMDDARHCFARYAATAPFLYQRREALRLSLSTWKWGRLGLIPRPDLRACPGPPA